MSIFCLVGSTNRVKVSAAQEALAGHHSETVTAEGYKADPGIREWRSACAIGQPFGVEQTAFGAIHRMQKCLDLVSTAPSIQRRFAVAFENGLVPGSEVGENGAKRWFDICFVAFQEIGLNFSLIHRGPFIQTPFSPEPNSTPVQFDAAVKSYESEIMPEIHRGGDLYRLWSGGVLSRQSCLQDCLSEALHESETLKVAQDVVSACVESGMAASAGPRYRNMLWTRDLAYMTPTYLMRGYSDEIFRALRAIAETQCSQHGMNSDGYQLHNSFGKIPIVTIAKGKESEWLRQRIRGDESDPFFQIQLWNFCQSHPELIESFPVPPRCQGDSIESMSLDHCTQDELVQYFHELNSFWKNEVREYTVSHREIKMPRGPSFALQAFIEGRLENLTPGTRDSEIQFLRALFTFVDFLPEEEKCEVLSEFGVAIGRALFHLTTSVINPDDHLPLGADTRDNFADILYDAKVLSNAVFWYRVLLSLVKYSDLLENTSVRQTIKDAISEHQTLTGRDAPNILRQIQDNEKKLSKIFEDEVHLLRTSIHDQLLFREEKFHPRDFVQGDHARIDLKDLGNTKSPIPNVALLQNENPGFLSGEEVDPQSLAQAVLAGLVHVDHYDKVIELLQQADSPIGVEVFVPISTKTEEESEVLKQAKGRVVWPHISWAIVQALIFIKESGASLKTDPLDFAERQREKLMHLPHSGCGEWYAHDPSKEERITGGGDPKQGWSAAQMLLGMQSFFDHYSGLRP